MRLKRPPWLLAAAWLCALWTLCAGEDNQPATKMMTINYLPEDVITPAQFIIWTGFRGSVEFIESDEFKIEINATAPSVLDLSKIRMDIDGQLDTVLLRVFSELPPEESPLAYIVLGIISACILVMVGAIIYVKWWDIKRRPYIKAYDNRVDPVTPIPVQSVSNSLDAPPFALYRDSSRAPLLNLNDSPVKNRYLGNELQADETLSNMATLQLQSRTKKKKRRKPRPQEDEFVSSEEENIGRHVVRPPGRHMGLLARDMPAHSGSGGSYSGDDRGSRPGSVGPRDCSDNSSVCTNETEEDRRRRLRSGKKSPEKSKPYSALDADRSSESNGEHEEDDDRIERRVKRTGNDVVAKRITGDIEPLEALEELSSGSGDEQEFPPPPPSIAESSLSRPSTLKRSNLRQAGSPSKAKPEKRVGWVMEKEDTSCGGKGGCYTPPYPAQRPGPQVRDGTADGTRSLDRARRNENVMPLSNYQQEQGRNSNGTVSSSSASSVITVINADERAQAYGSLGSRRSSNGSSPPSKKGSPPGIPGKKSSPPGLGGKKGSPPQKGSPGCSGANGCGEKDGTAKKRGSPPDCLGNGNCPPSLRKPKPPAVPRRSPDTTLVTATGLPGLPAPRSPSGGSPVLGARRLGAVHPAAQLTAKNLHELNGKHQPESSEDKDDYSVQGDDSGVGSSNGDTDTSSGQRSTERLSRIGTANSGGATPTPGATGGGNGGGGGGGASRGPSKGFMMTFSLMCILGMCTTVSAQPQDQPQIHMKVYAPRGIVRNGSTIYTSKQKAVDMVTMDWNKRTTILWYEVNDADLNDLNVKFHNCQKNKCTKGCDIRTGRCICPRGQVPDPNDLAECVDEDECLTGRNICGPNASCYNTEGSYYCQCNRGFYGDGVTCIDCNRPCDEGMFETEACSQGQPKVCKACTKSCGPGQYITRRCGGKRDILCGDCRKKCGPGEFEFSPCVGESNRKCESIETRIPEQNAIDNIVYEDQRKVRDTKTMSMMAIEGNGSYILERGSGYTVKIRLKKLNLTPMFVSVNHSKANDNEHFTGDPAILSQYCSHPMPEMYEMATIVHRNVTTIANKNKCAKGEKCSAPTGWYLDPYRECRTFRRFGRLPDFRARNSIPCSTSNDITDVFGVSPDLKRRNSMMVDTSASRIIDQQSRRCDRLGVSCRACSDQCGRMIQTKSASSPCAITPDESDNGYSPRLEYCYTCCVNDNCTNLCNGYYAKDCQPLRCISGNIAELTLTPVFPARKRNKFHCHVQPKQGQVIYMLEHSLWKNGEMIANETVMVRQEGAYPKDRVNSHKFIDVHYGFRMDVEPSLIEGYSGEVRFSGGVYDNRGSPVHKAKIAGGALKIKPNSPFEVNSQNWGKFRCDSELTNKLVVANASPFREVDTLGVEFYGEGHYRMMNRTANPYLQFNLPKSRSILQAFYAATTVVRSTFYGRILITKNNWVIKVYGSVEKCPGSFYVKIKDADYPNNNLFDYEVGIKCPRSFALQFNVPAGPAKTVNKTYVVEIYDNDGRAQMTLFRPSEEPKIPVRVEPSRTVAEPYLTMALPRELTLGVAALIAGLLVLLLLAHLTKTDHPLQKDNSFKKCHMVFLVFYCVYRTAYILTVTLTFVFFVCKALNQEPLKVLSEYHQHSDQIEMSQDRLVSVIGEFVTKELWRQNLQTERTKRQCEEHMKGMHKIFEQAMHSIPVKSAESRVKIALSTAAMDHTREMVRNLTQQLQNFRDDFNAYADETVYNLIQDIRQTYKDLEGSSWLNAARMIHESVRDARSSRGVSTIRPFMDWVGLQTELNQLSADLKMKNNIPLPDFANFPLMGTVEKPRFNQAPIPPERVALPHNIQHMMEDQPRVQFQNVPGRPLPSSRHRRPEVLDSWTILIVLVVIDGLWLLHRLARTVRRCGHILYGYPVHFDCTGKLGPYSVDDPEYEPNCFQRCSACLKQTARTIVKSEFLPVSIALSFGMFLCLSLLHHSDNMVNVNTLEKMGYFSRIVTPISTHHRISNVRISANADRINNVDLPFYERTVDARLQHYQKLLKIYNTIHCDDEAKLRKEHCRLSGEDKNCNGWKYETVTMKLSGCKLPRVIPELYKDYDEYSLLSSYRASSAEFVNAARQLLFNIVSVTLVYLACMAVCNLLGALLWQVLKRLELLRQDRSYKTDDPTTLPKHGPVTS